MANMRDTIEAYLKPKDSEELDAFGLWAFGEKFKDLDHSLLFMKAWNEIHGDKLTLTQDGIIQHDIPKMVEMWNEKN